MRKENLDNFNGGRWKKAVLAAALLFCFLVTDYSLGQRFCQAADFQIDGYYLGQSAEDLGITFEINPDFPERYFEEEVNGTLLFFIRTDEKLRLYRIVKEVGTSPSKVRNVLGRLKARYGTPDKQQVKTSSVRPKRRVNYVTTSKNRASWKISESQEFIAEIEGRRVVYELLDHDPTNIKPPQISETADGEPITTETWNPDY